MSDRRLPTLSLSKPEIRTGEERSIAIRQPHYLLVFLLLQALLLLCYSPVLSRTYAFCDDFYYLARSLRAPDWLSAVMREALLQGRPFDGLILDFSFLCLHRVSDLVLLRLAGIFGAACLAFVSYKLLLKADWPRVQSFCLALCLVTLPPFQVYISWAVAAPHIFSALAAYFAVRLGQTAGQRTGRLRFFTLAGAIASMFLAVGLYQPSAMFYWLFAAMIFFKRTENSARVQFFKQEARFSLMLLVVFAGACLLEMGVFESSKRYFGTAAVLPQRSHLTTHIAAKINWFINGPLVDALNFHRLQPSHKMACLIALFLAVGLFLYCKGNLYQRLMQISLAACLVPLSYLPNLAIAEDFVTYRTEAGLTALLVFYVFLASVGLAETLSKRFASPAITSLASLTAAASIVIANYNVAAFFVLPQTLELGLMKSQLAGNFGEKTKANPVLLKRDDTLAPFSRYDEFGLPSLCQPWVPEPVVFLIKQGLVDSGSPESTNGSRSGRE
jgi:hypothetical protein